MMTGATALGLFWILSFKTIPHQVSLPGASADQAPPDTTTPDSSTPVPTPIGATPGPTPAPTPTPARTGVNGTFTGQTVTMFYGPVQVRIVVSNGRITDAQAVQLPSDRAESAYISQQVGPMLRQEVIQAQNARIDIIGGATFTSEAYAQSLQSALQQAHLNT